MSKILSRFEGGPIDGHVQEIEETSVYEYEYWALNTKVPYLDDGPYMGVSEEYRTFKLDPSYDIDAFNARYNQLVADITNIFDNLSFEDQERVIDQAYPGVL